MSNTQSFESKAHNLADDAAKTADRAISNTKRVADNAADTFSARSNISSAEPVADEVWTTPPVSTSTMRVLIRYLPKA